MMRMMMMMMIMMLVMLILRKKMTKDLFFACVGGRVKDSVVIERS